MKRIAKHLSYSNVAATLAVVLALSGAAVAATGGFVSGGRLRRSSHPGRRSETAEVRQEMQEGPIID